MNVLVCLVGPDIRNANEMPPRATLAIVGLTQCEECHEYFMAARSSARFCGDKCRQAVFRRKPLTTSALIRQAEDVVRRGLRRDARFKMLNRDRSIAFDPVYSGPGRDDVPELESFRLPTRCELRARVEAEQQ